MTLDAVKPARKRTPRGAAPSLEGPQFLKWAGSKRRLLPKLLPRVPARVGTYVEPFLGGGALFFALAAERPRRFARAVLADVNPDLIAAYHAVRDRVEPLIEVLREWEALHSETHYYEVRALLPETLSSVERAARMIYLNKACFNGLWRVNGSGRHNVPWGKRVAPMICDAPKLRAAAEALQGVKVLLASFESSLLVDAEPLGSGDFAYLDPPYVGISDTADFVAFAAGGFDLTRQELLAEVAGKVADAGARVLASNSDLEFTRRAYEARGFVVEGIRAPRSIAASDASRGDVGEILASRGA